MSRKKKVEPQNQNLRAPKMAHIRHVKPEFFKSETVNDLSPLAALAWIGIWCQADKHGRFEWKPRVLRAEVLPYRDGVNFEELLHELARAGCVQEYSVDGRQYGQIAGWNQHQYISRREADSKFEYPAPTIGKTGTCDSATASTSPHVQERAGTCVNGAVLEGECVGEGEDVGVGQAGSGDAGQDRERENSDTPDSQTPARSRFSPTHPRTPRTSFSEKDRERLWTDISVLSADLLDAKDYEKQKEFVERAAEYFGSAFVLDKARHFLKRVRTDRDRQYAAKQFAYSFEKSVEAEYMNRAFAEAA